MGILNWLRPNKEKKFTAEEVRDLVERIKEFNAGCVDKQLTRHADNAFEQWLNEKQ